MFAREDGWCESLPVVGSGQPRAAWLALLAVKPKTGPALAGGTARVRIFDLTAPRGGATARGMPAPNHPDSHHTHSDQDQAAQADVRDQPEQRPTAKQFAYPRALADRAGQTFTYPRTRRQASAEIRRLRAQKATSRVERRMERRQIADATPAARTTPPASTLTVTSPATDRPPPGAERSPP
jgi:hypothetical protein